MLAMPAARSAAEKRGGNTETRKPKFSRTRLSHRRARRWSERGATIPAKIAHDRIDLGAVENLFFEQRFGDFVQQTKIGFEQILGFVITFLNDSSDLGVDLDGGTL